MGKNVNKRTSVIWNLNKEELINVVSKSKYWISIIRELGISVSGAVYRTLRQRLDEDNIDYSHINRNHFS